MLEMIQQWDEQTLQWIEENLRTVFLDDGMVFYTSLGNGGVIFILTGAALLAFRSTRNVGTTVLTSLGLGALVTNLTLKPLISRPRPWEVMEFVVPLVTTGDPDSFPSGHTCAAFAFASAVCATVSKKWVKAAAVAAAALMGISRIYVGVHFPTDVLSGAAVGSLCGVAGARIVREIRKKYYQRKAAK